MENLPAQVRASKKASISIGQCHYLLGASTRLCLVSKAGLQACKCAFKDLNEIQGYNGYTGAKVGDNSTSDEFAKGAIVTQPGASQ